VENMADIYPRTPLARVIRERATSLLNREMPEDSIRALIHQTERRQAQVVVDAREFWPGHTRFFHRGSHPEVMHGGLADMGFHEALARVRQVAREWRRSPTVHSAELVIVVFCQRGITLSVAAGTLLAFCLVHDSWCGSLVNICEDLGGTKFCRHSCSECNPTDTTTIKRACRAALDLWRAE
jgi:hypothetical protein